MRVLLKQGVDAPGGLGHLARCEDLPQLAGRPAKPRHVVIGDLDRVRLAVCPQNGDDVLSLARVVGIGECREKICCALSGVVNGSGVLL